MTTTAIRRVLRHLSRHASPHRDADLLDRFTGRRDEAAFEELLRRHGPMVRAVCRRVLGPTADADDAFQATFLVLVRRAGSVRQSDLLANWLCAVAYRTANQARRRRARTGGRERQVERLPEPGYDPPPPRDWLPFFDEALQRLPERFRTPLVLCELQGRSRADAARELGLNENTLSSRLARGRELLRQRLGHLGFPLSVGAALAPAVVPDALAATTMRYAGAVVSLSLIPESILQITDEVVRNMTTSKLKYAAALLVGALLVTGIGLRTGGPKAEATPADAPAKPAPTPDVPPIAPVDPKPRPVSPSEFKEYQALAGTWTLTRTESAGKSWKGGFGKKQELTATFRVNGVVMEVPNFARGTIMPRGFLPTVDEIRARVVVDPAANPKRIDLDGPVDRYGIYKIDGDTLTICLGPANQKLLRPSEFATSEQTLEHVLLVYARRTDLGPAAKLPVPPAIEPPADADAIVMTTAQLRIPLSIDPDRANQLSGVLLFISYDRGKTWVQEAHTTASPAAAAFDFRAPNSGVYWFSVVCLYKDGRQEPANLRTMRPDLKVRVDLEKSGLPAIKLPASLPVPPPAPETGEAQLRREIAELRQRLDALEKKIAAPKQ